MKKIYLLSLTLAILMPFFFSSCIKDVDPPQSDFSATVSTSISGISITFTDFSSNSPDQWFWTFEGGNPSTSTEQNPTVTYSSPGTFDVTLIAKNEGGENEIVKYDYINVVQFNNPLFTDMDVTVDDITKTMSPDNSVQFAKIDNTSIPYTAETSGKTTSGTQVGLLMSWNGTADLTIGSSWNLRLTDDYIYFYITNTSNYYLTPFYVNYGTSSQTIDDIVIPWDGVKYGTGYYYAFSGMEVRAYHQNSSTQGVSWINPTNLTIPWINNQSANLSYSKSSKVQSERAIDYNSEEPEMLYPAIETGSKMVIDPNAKNITQSNAK